MVIGGVRSLGDEIQSHRRSHCYPLRLVSHQQQLPAFIHKLLHVPSAGFSKGLQPESRGGKLCPRVRSMSHDKRVVAKHLQPCDDVISARWSTSIRALRQLSHQQCLRRTSPELHRLPSIGFQLCPEPQSCHGGILYNMHDLPFDERLEHDIIQPFDNEVSAYRKAHNGPMPDLPCRRELPPHVHELLPVPPKRFQSGIHSQPSRG